MKELIITGILASVWVVFALIGIAIIYGTALIINYVVKQMDIFSSKQKFWNYLISISGTIILAGCLFNFSLGWSLFGGLTILWIFTEVWAVILYKNRQALKALFYPNQQAQQ
jgi:hypothetical protein